MLSPRASVRLGRADLLAHNTENQRGESDCCVAPAEQQDYNLQAIFPSRLDVKDDGSISMEAPQRIPFDGPSDDPALTPFQQLRYAREIIQLEAGALLQLADRLNADFSQAVSYIYRCQSSVIVTGMGKAGLVGQKIAATLASTGTRSHYLHPAEAFHGDLGRIHRNDVVLVLSQSGRTEEITRLMPSLRELDVTVLAMTRDRLSPLGQSATLVLELGPLQEACSLGLAPSTSTTAMLAYGDALALVTSRMRAFSKKDFARFHPGGSLGRSLSNVDDHLRPVARCRVANRCETLRDVLVQGSIPGRRSGAVMILDDDDRLSGIFTDSDLARLFEGRGDGALDRPIEEVMTQQPVSVPAGSMVNDAMAIMAERKLSELPVIDPDGKPLGLLDITDLVEWGSTDSATGLPPAGLGQEARTPHPDVPRPMLLGDRQPNWPPQIDQCKANQFKNERSD